MKMKISIEPKTQVATTETYHKNTLIVIMGKSLSGKSYLQNHLVKAGFPKLITTTSRPKRAHEQNGVDYYFVDSNNKISDETKLALREYHVANGETWEYYLSRDEFINKMSHLPVATLILDLKGYLMLQQQLAELQSKNSKLNNINILGLYLDTPLKTRLHHYLDTDRQNESEKEFVRRLYDDETNAFKELEDPNFARNHKILVINPDNGFEQLKTLLNK